MKLVLMVLSYVFLYCIYYVVFFYYFKEEKILRGCVVIIYEVFKKKRLMKLNIFYVILFFSDVEC